MSALLLIKYSYMNGCSQRSKISLNLEKPINNKQRRNLIRKHNKKRNRSDRIQALKKIYIQSTIALSMRVISLTPLQKKNLKFPLKVHMRVQEQLVQAFQNLPQALRLLVSDLLIKTVKNSLVDISLVHHHLLKKFFNQQALLPEQRSHLKLKCHYPQNTLKKSQ